MAQNIATATINKPIASPLNTGFKWWVGALVVLAGVETVAVDLGVRLTVDKLVGCKLRLLSAEPLFSKFEAVPGWTLADWLVVDTEGAPDCGLWVSVWVAELLTGSWAITPL